MKKEKNNNELLSQDLIDRIIRVEQKICRRHNKNIQYKDTYYFKSLSSKEKKDYEKFLHNRTRKALFFYSALMIFLMVFFSQVRLTGNAILGNPITIINYFPAVLILVVIFIYLLYFILKRSREKRFDDCENIINKVIK